MSYSPAPVTYGVSAGEPCWCNCADGCGDNCSASCCEGCNCTCLSCPGCCVESAPGRCHLTMTITFSVLSLIALIFYIVATSTREWTTGFLVTAGPYVNQTGNLGLFEFCSDSWPGCADFDSLNYPGVIDQDDDVWSKVQTVRAFSLIAIFFTFVAWLLNFPFMCRYVLWLKWFVLANGFIGVFSGLIAMSVWVSLNNDWDSGDLGYSLGLEAAAWPILFLACLLLWFVDWGVVFAGGFAAPPVIAGPPPSIAMSNTVAYPPQPGFAAPYPTTSYAAAFSQPYSQPY